MADEQGSSSDEKFDLIVIGAGPGGYTAAIRAAQLGMSVACIEKESRLGGTCLRVGCIPSKALLDSSELYAKAAYEFEEHGIGVGELSLDVGKLIKRKEKVVQTLTGGIGGLFKKNKVQRIQGTGHIVAPGKVRVEGDEEYELTADRILIATGSVPAAVPGLDFDETHIVSSTGALAFDAVPERFLVVGGGYIGLELGSVWARLGAQVHVVEMMDRILPAMDKELAGNLHEVLESQGLSFELGAKVAGAERNEDGKVDVRIEPAEGDARFESYDRVLVAVGRTPFTDGLGLDEIGVERDDRGFIPVDENFQTNVDGVYAIGDVVPGPMLAHKAEEDAVVAVERMDGQGGRVHYDLVPAAIYTWPEFASVGKTEEELQDDGVEYRVGKFPFRANGRARASGDIDGMAKVLADAKTDRVLGVHILGPRASDLIAECVIAMEFGASAEDIARTCHAHPTFPEAVKEAALAVDNRAINF